MCMVSQGSDSAETQPTAGVVAPSQEATLRASSRWKWLLCATAVVAIVVAGQYVHVQDVLKAALDWKFTHAADSAARIVIQNALFLGRKKLSALTMPWCTYTDPEVAHVGLYERDARARGVEVDTYVRDFKEVDRAILDGEEEGFVKVHVKKGRDKILGATIVARHAGEMISEVSVAMPTIGPGLLQQSRSVWGGGWRGREAEEASASLRNLCPERVDEAGHSLRAGPQALPDVTLPVHPGY
jgi:hypothetical protein